jgi:prepilin-type N-terminal cleavage/methylation domain-containing protein
MIPMFKPLLKGQRGFTLIELLAVIAILTVLSTMVALAITGVSASGQSARLRGDADTLGKAADRFFNDAFPQRYPVASCCAATDQTPQDILTAGDLGVRLINFEAVLPGDPTKTFVPSFLKEVPDTAALVSWRIDTRNGQVFFAQDGAQLILPSNNRLNISATTITTSTSEAIQPSDYTYNLRMKKSEAALEILEVQIPAGYSIGGQSVAVGTLMGTLSAKLLTDNPWSPGQVLTYTGDLKATGRSNEWMLSVDYPNVVNTTTAQVSGRADRDLVGATETRHQVTLVTPSLEAAGSMKILLNTNGDTAHNQATEEWTLTIYGRAGNTSSGAAVITNPTNKGVYRWLAKEQTTIDVAGAFNDVTGNQAVVIKAAVTPTPPPTPTPVPPTPTPTPTPTPPPPTLGSWATKAPMSTARNGLSLGGHNGTIYAAGGWNGFHLTTLEAYNAITNTWAAKASILGPQTHAASGVINGVLYLAGGTNCCVETNTFTAYDIGTNSWTIKPNMPTVRQGAVGGVIGGKLYVAGGINTQNQAGRPPLATLEMFDPGTNGWSSLAPMPTARSVSGGGVVNGIFYVVGGVTNLTGSPTTVVATLEAYDTCQQHLDPQSADAHGALVSGRGSGERNHLRHRWHRHHW